MSDLCEMLTCSELIKRWLIDNHFDGLCFPEEECGCSIDDFMPCDGIDGPEECLPGYKIPCDCGTPRHTEWIWASECIGRNDK